MLAYLQDSWTHNSATYPWFSLLNLSTQAFTFLGDGGFYQNPYYVYYNQIIFYMWWELNIKNSKLTSLKRGYLVQISSQKSSISRLIGIMLCSNIFVNIFFMSPYFEVDKASSIYIIDSSHNLKSSL